MHSFCRAWRPYCALRLPIGGGTHFHFHYITNAESAQYSMCGATRVVYHGKRASPGEKPVFLSKDDHPYLAELCAGVVEASRVGAGVQVAVQCGSPR